MGKCDLTINRVFVSYLKNEKVFFDPQSFCWMRMKDATEILWFNKMFNQQLKGMIMYVFRSCSRNWELWWTLAIFPMFSPCFPHVFPMFSPAKSQFSSPKFSRSTAPHLRRPDLPGGFCDGGWFFGRGGRLRVEGGELGASAAGVGINGYPPVN